MIKYHLAKAWMVLVATAIITFFAYLGWKYPMFNLVYALIVVIVLTAFSLYVLENSPAQAAKERRRSDE